jgi:hypothetical protein
MNENDLAMSYSRHAALNRRAKETTCRKLTHFRKHFVHRSRKLSAASQPSKPEIQNKTKEIVESIDLQPPKGRLYPPSGSPVPADSCLRSFCFQRLVSKGCGGDAPRLQSADPMGLSVMKSSCLGGGLPPLTPPATARAVPPHTEAYFSLLTVCFKRSRMS